MHTLAGWWKSSGETRRIKKKKIHKTPTILRLEPDTTKEESCCPKQKAWEKPLCTRSQFFSWPGKSEEYGSDMGHLSPHISGHIALYGSRLLHSQEDLWKTTTWSYGRLGCDFGYLGNIHEDDHRAAVHLGKDYDMNLRFVKNYLWKTTGQLFSETEKLISGQTETIGKSMINFQDLRWVDKLIAQPSLSICHCRSLRLLRFCPPNSLT